MNHTIKTLAADVRKVMLDRIQSASNADLLAIACSLFADDEPPAADPAYAAATAAAKSRFTLYDIHGSVVSSGCVAVYDAETNLTWTRKPLECGAVPWKDAMTAAANYRLFGKDDWRAPTLKERVSIVDYAKFGPALYSEFDAGGASWEWTSTVDAEDPSDYAWFVFLRYGLVGRYGRTDHSGVRAVRAGQPLSLGI
jgi:hypothetical protein